MLKATGPLSIVLLASVCPSSDAAPLSSAEFNYFARECAPSVAPSTLAAIAQVESRFDPLTAHDNTTGETLLWQNQAQAKQIVTDRLDARHSLDVGLMQINSRNFSMLGLTPEEALQPCTSLSAAANLLGSRYAGGDTAEEEQLALRRAISAYNTGDFTHGFANGYVRKVETAAQQLVPPITERPKDDHERPRSEETWDVWGSYKRRSPEGGPGGSSGPPPPPDQDKRKDDNQPIFDLNEGGQQ
ncbi:MULTISPECIES: type IV secretion system lytic transglycosylase VirB1 [Rhizobium]|uniref:Type IV secretion system lytic transglycosylase VirB1 n=1 Tax=Rhizobium tumorigenes TaxID=2041385 RepID=A0AAF1KE30_9HYPH|nr:MULTISPECIES: type IV secretion system lytic transglycosylase VirB1 [Rhizobium]MBO9101872.1 type IV secretion system lytic transglycosylase VirB1 [Rhizobium sp. L58/93]MBO9172043.1 type IV secretion system lytic transglycosylase VirB1 [Rhizobium sp. L245/93]MBO9187903.1 type IV secretion system lytic transglycosylase VirB1 [Rhizobium sp. E27B/91]QXZ87670.1 type IV secretion system lytic transglycosylase VirB1 [Rhizobium sp. K1/93]QXZ93711.1 type IV secretion system lytic transglycosylase Vi